MVRERLEEMALKRQNFISLLPGSDQTGRAETILEHS